MIQELIALIEQSAKARGEEPLVPRKFIAKALEKIENGGEEVEKYPTGAPSLKGVYEIAVKLFNARCRNCGGDGRKYVIDRVVQGQDYGPETEGHYVACPQCGGSGVLLSKEGGLRMNETFRKLISEKLGLDFVPRPNSTHFLVSIQAFPKKVITDNELLPCVIKCFSNMGFEPDMDSVSPKDDFTWMTIRKGNEVFSVGITNTIMPPFCIIITVARLYFLQRT